MLASLIRCGELADAYSQSRRMKIALTLSGEGMLVTGTLFDEFGIVATDRYNLMVQWPVVFSREKAVEHALEEIHTKVQERWRAQG